MSKAVLRIQPRLLLSDQIAFGPGKADLLEAILHTGSISAAGKQLGMSYRRAWQLVDTMNRCFTVPLVETAKGGASGGGAQVTDFGRQVLEDYRNLQQTLLDASSEFAASLQTRLRDEPLATKDA